MISFKIPTSDLRLFLIALNMNFDMPEPDYIFQVPDGFEVVYTKEVYKNPFYSDTKNKEVCARITTQVDKFVAELWAHKNGNL